MNFFLVQSCSLLKIIFLHSFLPFCSYFLILKKSILNLASWRIISVQSLDVVECNFPAVSLICDPS